MQFSIADVASVEGAIHSLKFGSVNHYPREFLNIPPKKKCTNELGTLENKLNDLKPLFSRRERFAFQKKSKRMLLHRRANIHHKKLIWSHVPYMTSQYETNL